MFKFTRIAVPAAAAVALIVSAGAAFAAPVFTNAAPGNGMAIGDFESQLDAFNAKDVTDLVSAKAVSVYKYDDAWTDGSDNATAVNLLSDDAQTIGLLREALKANPQASKLLAENHIVINDVVDIVSNTDGTVSLYIS